MEMLIIAVLATWALKAAAEKGKAEYTHTREQRAAEFSRAHPEWSARKVGRHARRAARGYWTDQIRNGFPDLKAAYRQERELAATLRAERELKGREFLAELAERRRKAQEQAARLDAEEQDEPREEPDRPAAEDPAGPDAPRSRRGRRLTLVPCGRCGRPVPPESLTEVETDSEITRICLRCVSDGDPEPGATSEPPQSLPEPEPARSEREDEQSSPRGTDPDRPPDGPDDDPPPEPAPRPTVVPINRPAAATPVPEPATPSGGNMNATTVSGEVHGGYEQILASYEADITRLEEMDGVYEQRIAYLQTETGNLQNADSAYEQRIAGLRALNADESTVGDVARLREANEQQIAAATDEIEKTAAAREANQRQILAAREARDNWVSRQGAVKDTRDATGARGDDALYA